MTFHYREKAEGPAASSGRTKRSLTVLIICAAVAGSLLDAIVVPAKAASAQASLDPSDFVYEIAGYSQQFVQWIQDYIDTVLHAYSLDSRQVYCMALILSILAVFVCLMVKAFTLGKVAAERMSRDR